jgi:hypothetical protein
MVDDKPMVIGADCVQPINAGLETPRHLGPDTLGITLLADNRLSGLKDFTGRERLVRLNVGSGLRGRDIRCRDQQRHADKK